MMILKTDALYGFFITIFDLIDFSNIDREEFEHLNIDFEKHIKNFHNMWAYVWFIIHLETSPREEYTGQEEYIWNLYCESNISFFPIKQVLQFSNEITEVVIRLCKCMWRIKKQKIFQVFTRKWRMNLEHWGK